MHQVSRIAPAVARLYFGVQSIAVAAWWTLLATRPSTRALFRVAGAPDASLLAFAPGDLALLTLGSAALALSGRGASAWRVPLAWLVAGAAVYAAAYTLALAASGAAGPLGAALMVPAAAASVLCAHALQRGSR